MTRFAILATQRTGSTWVARMLNSHPAVDVFGELFDRRATHVGSLTEFRRRPGHRRWHRGVGGYLDQFYAAGDAYDAVGFKLMYQHARENPSVLAYLGMRNVSVVHLVRSNLLDIVVSNETARIRERFHSSQELDQVAVSLDPKRLIRRLSWLDLQVRAARATLRLTRVPALEVTYESLAADPRGFADILRFLGVEATEDPLRSGLRKLNRVPRHELVENYAEIERVVRRTRFARFLD